MVVYTFHPNTRAFICISELYFPKRNTTNVALTHTFLSWNHPHGFNLSLSHASTSMQKTLLSLWGFATAHFHGKSSVLCSCQRCQVLIIHCGDSQSKAETQMSLCHRNPPGWGKACLYITGRKETYSHWLAATPLSDHFDDQALSICVLVYEGQIILKVAGNESLSLITPHPSLRVSLSW